MISRRALLAAGSAALVSDARANERMITGINLAGLEFNSGRLPGRLHHDFVAPDGDELDYYHNAGARAVRLPFRWERLQPELGAEFDRDHWRLLEQQIAATRTRGMRLILDPHQYGRRRVQGENVIIGETPAVTVAHFAGFWGDLARRCRAEGHVVFGLQNEPHDQDIATLVRVNTACIAAIRGAGAGQLILVPGSAWTGAHSWVSSGNAAAMRQIADANFAFDVHQYLDRDSSGRSRECALGAHRRLERFTTWARAQGKRGFLGEFGAGNGETCLAELNALLAYMASNRDVWIGWTCWGAGPWWPDDYPLKIGRAEHSARESAQMTVLRRYFE